MNKEMAKDILDRVSAYGTAPDEGCADFGVGYDKYFDAMCKYYVDDGFARGKSAEKFVIGPYGSGKTHFLRHFMEMARDKECVTAEVALSKDIDPSKPLLVYKEVARQIRAPGQRVKGVQGLLRECIDIVGRDVADQGVDPQEWVRGWIKTLREENFESRTFERVVRAAMEAHLDDDDRRFEQYGRWLEGEVDDRVLAKQLDLSPIAKAQQDSFGRQAQLSLCQLVHHVRFAGTVICFDEAEQSFSAGGAKREKIRSMLQSSINATADVQDGSFLVLYAVTPDVEEEFMKYPPLAQRLEVPSGREFFRGDNVKAAIIDLREAPEGDPVVELQRIGESLVSLLYDHFEDEVELDRDSAIAEVGKLAMEVAEREVSTSNRRTMAKRAAGGLVNLVDRGHLDFGNVEDISEEPEEGEV